MHSITSQSIPSGSGDVNGPLDMNITGNHILHQQLLNDAMSGKYAAYDGIEGNAFLGEEPIVSTLVLNNGAELKDVPLNIDLYKQEIVTKNSKDESQYINRKYYKGIIIPFEDKELLFEKINPENPDQFYEVLYNDGKLAFFKERYVTVKEAVKNGLSNRPKRFTNRTNYFIKRGKGQVSKVKLKKKSFFKNVSKSKAKSMKNFAKENGLKLKKEADFIAVLNGTRTTEISSDK